MPVNVTYPGVYIQELPSGVQTITGVATSIGAFVGWAPMGPTDSGPAPITQATLVQSFQDFANQFGGLDIRSNLGYAVSHFFNNGGQQAYIVRLVDTTAQAAVATVVDGMQFSARNQGQWGNNYSVTVTPNVAPGDTTRFRVDVAFTPSGATPATVETFPNLSINPNDSQYVFNVIPADSQFITALASGTLTQPTGSPVTVALGSATAGNDGNILKPGPLFPGDPFPPPTSGPAVNGVASIGNFLAALAVGGTTGGVNLLTRVSIFNILCIPGLADTGTIQNLQNFVAQNFAFFLVDSVVSSVPATDITTVQTQVANIGSAVAINEALYFPWISAPDPLNQNRARPFPPCGFVAGIYAATDAARGVWKAPAGTNASLTGALGLNTVLTDQQNGTLNPLGINCLRNFPVYGNVVWGARTLAGNDQIGSQWKYVPVKRVALFIEKSLLDGTKFAVFEPNAEPLWSELRLAVGTFMQDLFRQGAFAGESAAEAFFVKCDSQTTTQTDINNGIVNILVGFAPLQPAEFVVIQIQQIAGQAQA